MKRFPRGSEWRKWDLHVHAPGTKLADGYTLKDGKPDWNQFCQIVHDSDVDVIGIADYFSLDSFFAFKEHYDRLYPNSDKVFFPNLELRLNESVNTAGDVVDFHIIFPPDLTQEEATKFLGSLKTQLTAKGSRPICCSELFSSKDYGKPTVSRADIRDAVEAAYGPRAVWTDHFLLVVAANNNGIRADSGSTRKKYLADEIDKLADACFGNPASAEHFLKTDRLEDSSQKIAKKPVFAGCDAHSFDDLAAWLGQEASDNNAKHVTWVKADPTFEGLQQTLIEPSERVRIQTTTPDKKERYKVISRIVFKDSDEFPDEVVLNSGLNAIIGSRSSGKSALLAYIAHAVDPDYTVRQQVDTGVLAKDAGPGASITWSDVKDIDYSIEWASKSATEGQVIYIPQNSLYLISERPNEITEKIRPAVFRGDPDFEAVFRQAEEDVKAQNKSIDDSLSTWFDLASDISELTTDAKDLGDKQAISDRIKELEDEISELQQKSKLSKEEVSQYQQVMSEITKNKARLDEIEQEERDLLLYVKKGTKAGTYETTDQVTVAITLKPAPSAVPAGIRLELDALATDAKSELLAKVKSKLTDYRAGLDAESTELAQANKTLEDDNKDLIAKSVANTQIAALVKDLDAQREALAAIGKAEAAIKSKKNEQGKLIKAVQGALDERAQVLERLETSFNGGQHELEDMVFTMEVEWNPSDIEVLSSRFNLRETSPYIVDHRRIDIDKVVGEAGKFVELMGSGKQKLKQGERPIDTTRAVLTATQTIRFVASLDGDRIGGFKKSSMTPGKQALFALTLILAESGEPWPLLIDQPEDDLDSRSVCDVIIKDLMRRKRERQVIMVSHNANLVIGADSEEIIVANRHGDDRKNKDGMTFEYLTGSLEHSQPKNPKAKTVLESAGIREHACEILDGGEEAFQKRKEKYRI